MCSIVGAAGPIHELSANKRAEFHEFLSCLFAMAELRGRDAAGFWVWRGDHYVWEKRPIPAEDLIDRSPRWKGLRYNPGTLYLLHTRAATDGDPNENRNNHPHIGEHSVMIHNGMIWGHQAIVNRHNLTMKTDCDSEVLLRLAECVDDIKEGLKFMFDTTADATGSDSIATAFVDRRSPDRIYLSRNSGNPCYIYKSEHFGCTFFCSTEDIFERALDMLYNTKSPKVIGAKSESITTDWLYELHADGTVEKELLVEPKYSHYHAQHSQYNRSWGSDDDDDIEITLEREDYVRTTYDGDAMSININGEMTLMASEEEEEDEEDNADLEFLDSVQMPKSVEDELVEFLDEKIREGNI